MSPLATLQSDRISLSWGPEHVRELSEVCKSEVVCWVLADSGASHSLKFGKVEGFREVSIALASGSVKAQLKHDNVYLPQQCSRLKRRRPSVNVLLRNDFISCSNSSGRTNGSNRSSPSSWRTVGCQHVATVCHESSTSSSSMRRSPRHRSRLWGVLQRASRALGAEVATILLLRSPRCWIGRASFDTLF